jgi:hypothetical protein
MHVKANKEQTGRQILPDRPRVVDVAEGMATAVDSYDLPFPRPIVLCHLMRGIGRA